MEEGGFLYDADSYGDDLPFWIKTTDRNHLVVPYSLDNNDMRFVTASGFANGDQFFTYLKDAFDCLYLEGEESPKMMSVGLHGRIVGRPGRIRAFINFGLRTVSRRRLGLPAGRHCSALGARTSAIGLTRYLGCRVLSVRF